MISVWQWGIAASTALAFSHVTAAECSIPEQAKMLDPVEVGFCESDAVFVGVVEGRMETIRAYREEGSDRTKHYRLEIGTVRVTKSYKDKLPEKITTNADLYDKKGAFSFEREKEYLVFAKRLPAGEYAGASAACSVQPTVPLTDATKILEQLDRHVKGSQKIDCKNIRVKS
jgi:hypothetical protein